MNIYELSQEAEALRLAIEEQGGEITPEQLAQLEVNAANAAEKVDYYYKSLADAKALDEAIAAEIKRLQARRKENAAYMDAVIRALAAQLEGLARVTVEADKTAIKARLQAGEDIEGAAMGESHSVTFK